MTYKHWLVAASLILATGLAHAGTRAIGIGGVAGTLGVGAQVSYAITDYFSVRGMAAGFSTSLSFKAQGGSDFDYEGDVDLLHIAALVDYHPFGGSFRLSAGVMFNDDSVYAKATCMQAVCGLGNEKRLMVRGDNVEVSIGFNSVSPYIGLGWGQPPGPDGGWGFSADIGLFYLGDPQVEVDAHIKASTVAPGRVKQAEKQEAQGIEEDLSALSVYPVVMLGVSYQF